jgi:hypothetical protein
VITLAVWLLALPFRLAFWLGLRRAVILVCLLVLAVTGYGVAEDLGLLEAPAHASPTRRPAPPSSAAKADIPRRYLAAYRQGARSCRGLSWTWLAAIGRVESNHGRGWPQTGGPRTPGVTYGTENYAGAGGPMQFLEPTWRQYGRGDRWRIEDAAPAAARLLCANGAPRDMGSALWAYNPSRAYAASVRQWTTRYRAGRG